MKSNIISAIIAGLLICIPVSAQVADAEKEFEKRKASFLVEYFSIGEDASSGYDYVVYRSGDKIVKIRVVWMATYAENYEIREFFFCDGKLSLHSKYEIKKSFFGDAKKGRNVPATVVEKLYFTGSKLTAWTEKDREVSGDDPRWREKEKQTLQQAKDELEMYETLKEWEAEDRQKKNN